MSRNPPPPQNPSTEKNAYIPAFISQKPFWVPETETEADYLQHQRNQAEPKDTLDKAKWYERGRKAGPAATKFRKGACENCGAMTHKTKECLSRPRKQGAKWTGKDIQADELVEDVKLGWDAKRDRWNGYDAREYDNVVKDYEDLEKLRKVAQLKSPDGEHPRQTLTDADGDDDETSDAKDAARYTEETDMGRNQATSTRQLRLREDTAAYLRNLDLESAKYDPKTRTMDTSTAALSNGASTDLASDGFTRAANSSDDATAFERAQRYAWETQESQPSHAQAKLHLQANPTEGEILLRKQASTLAERKAARAQFLADKYGTTLTATPNGTTTNTTGTTSKPHLLSSEKYTEYDATTGLPVSDDTAGTKPRSKYAEDVLTNNHDSVWGSFWRDFRWGYACCHSTTRNSYCTGEEGRLAFGEAEMQRVGMTLEIEPPPVQEGVESKKRSLHEIQSGVSEEIMESYKRSKIARDDPMNSVLGRDELVS